MASRAGFAAVVGVLGSVCAPGCLGEAPLKPALPSEQPSVGAARGATAQRGGEPLVAELFVMSQCPYGNQMEAELAPAVKLLGPSLDLRVEFIGESTPNGLRSMHGPSEVAIDLLQACALAHSTHGYELILCQNDSRQGADWGFDRCAAELGVPAAEVRACAEGAEGERLLAASFARAAARGATGSPTFFIAGERYGGSRRASRLSLALCDSYAPNKPAACAGVKEPSAVNIAVLADSRCPDCEVEHYVEQLRSAVERPVLSVIDYDTPAGKQLFEAVGVHALPFALFDGTLDGDPAARATFARALTPASASGPTGAPGSPARLLPIGTWNPLCADAGGCELAECRSSLVCRAEEPHKLDVFLMSECPFGVLGMRAMREVLDNFRYAGAKIDFAMHFIGEGRDAASFASMHGPTEVEEDLRQACAVAHYGKDLKYLDYVWCRGFAPKDPNWRACTGPALGIDGDVLQKCVSGAEGPRLLAESFALSEHLGIAASPTWLANGRHKFSGIDAETIKTELCRHNALPGCDHRLTGPSGSAGGGSCGD